MAKTDRTIFSATDQPPSGRGAAALSKGVRRGPHPFGLHLGNMICASAGKPAQLAAALAGVEAWRGHAFHRPDHQMPIRLTMGTMNIRDYGGDGPPVLLVPSLVNPAYILDLLPQNSLIGALRAQGLSPLLLDWGQPGEEERHFGLAHYVDRISQSITALAEVFGRPISVVGYCMGGTLSLAASLMDSSHISRLALLAAPWDFHAHAARHRSLAAMALSLVPVIERLGYAPVDLVQSFFTGLNPSASLSKFTRFSRLDPQSAEAELFVALEDWANNGPPLAGPVAIEVLRDWYALNMPGQRMAFEGSSCATKGVPSACFCRCPQAGCDRAATKCAWSGRGLDVRCLDPARQWACGHGGGAPRPRGFVGSACALVVGPMMKSQPFI
ncbi:alpha/beta fold hydrolase [Iodidimonas gelatinilytica]|nr:alpha/beta fold hydrolase [Iodidimonas gelatinilytica]